MGQTVVKRVVHNDVPRLLKKVKARALRSGAGYGVERAMIYVPVRTGNLRRSIRVIDDDSFGSDVHYAGYVEDGTRYMSARPYMEPAARDVADEMPQIVKRELKKWALGG